MNGLALEVLKVLGVLTVPVPGVQRVPFRVLRGR